MRPEQNGHKASVYISDDTRAYGIQGSFNLQHKIMFHP